MKKIFKRLIILLFCIIIVTVGVLIYLIIDDTNNTNKDIINNNISLDLAIAHNVYESIDDISSSGEVMINLDEYDINEILYALSKDIDLGVFKVNSMYIELTSDRYRFCAPVSCFGINSLISGNLKIYEIDEIINIEISDIYVGKLHIDTPILGIFNLKEKIINLLNDYYIDGYFDADGIKASISRKNLGLLIEQLTKDSLYHGLIMALYNVFMIDTNIVNIDVIRPNYFNISIDLAYFEGIKSEEFNSINDYSYYLLSNNYIDILDVNLIGNYHVNGYERLNDLDKERIVNLLSQYQDEKDIKGYDGLIKKDNISLSSILLSQLEVNPDYLIPGFKISDTDINGILSMLEFIGFTYVFTDYKNFKSAYIVIERLYTVIGDDSIDLFLDININGYVITINVGLTAKESQLVLIEANVNDVYLGNYKLNDENVNYLFNFLTKILVVDFIKTDIDDLSIIFDFTVVFNENVLLKNIIEKSTNVVTVCKKHLLIDGGYINITFTLF